MTVNHSLPFREMPLILLCGYPCSGKTSIAEKLVEMIKERKPDCEIEIVSEEAIARANQAYKGVEGEDPREAIYKNTALEKQFRAQIRSEVSTVMSIVCFIFGLHH